MAAAYDLAKQGGAFSISFVAKRTSVKALIYFHAPKSATDLLDAEEQEDVVDGTEAEDGRRVMPSSANEQHRARRDANPATAPHTQHPNAPQTVQMASMCNVHSRELTVRTQPRAVRPRPEWTATLSARALMALLESARFLRPRSLLIQLHHQVCVSARMWRRCRRRVPVLVPRAPRRMATLVL